MFGRYNTKTDDGEQIKESDERIAETMAMLRGPRAASLEFVSNIGQKIVVRAPVAEGGKEVSLRITSAAGNERNEWWDVSKLESWLEAGFFVRTDGEAYRQWSRPQELPFRFAPKVDGAYAKEVTDKAADLAKRLGAAGDREGAAAVLDLLGISGHLPEWKVDELRDEIAASAPDEDGAGFRP